jgi:L-2-hydroxyglutarate oxidase
LSLKTCDFLVVGAGVIGISVARELVFRYSDAKIIVIDKDEK